jgi:hypothetical protein
MTALTWQRSDSGLTFTVRDGDKPLPIAQWARALANGSGLRVGPLLQALDDDAATADSTGTAVTVSPAVIAEWTPQQVTGLGLPPVCTATMRLSKRGLLTDTDCHISVDWLENGIRPLVGAAHSPTFLEYGSRKWTVLNPLRKLPRQVDSG